MARRTPAQYDWSAVEFDERILRKHFTAPRRQKIAFVVAHHSTIVGKGTGSANDTMYNVWQSREASAHYGVDGDYVMQFVWDGNAAWATGHTTGNHAGISIEHANATAGPRWTIAETTWKNGAKLVAHLHKVYKLGRPTSTNSGRGGTLRKHSAFASTACPGPFMDSIWSKYVAEAQRVYDSITKPAPKPQEPAVPAVFRIAHLNVGGANHAYFLPWAQRRDMLHDLLLGVSGLRASVYNLVEVNTAQQHEDIMKILGKNWSAIRAAANNHIYYDHTKQRRLSSREDLLGSLTTQKRGLTQANFQHIASGVKWWDGVTHFSSNGGDPDLGNRSRIAETKKSIELMKTKTARGILTGDINSATEEAGYPRSLFKAAGWLDLRSRTTVANATSNTYAEDGCFGADGKWLDEAFTRGHIKVSNARVHPSDPSVTDHRPLVFTVEIA